MAAQRASLNKRRSVLDAVLGRRQIAAPRLGTTTAPSSTNICTRVRDVEQRTARLDAWLDVPKPKVDGAPVPAQRLQGPGRRILPHHVRPDRARPAHRHDARRHLHERQRRQRPGHSGNRHHAVAPSTLASQRRPRSARPPGQERRLHHAAVRLFSRQAQVRPGGRRAAARPHDGPVRQRHELWPQPLEQQSAHPAGRRPRARAEAWPAHRLQPAAGRQLQARLRRMARACAADPRTKRPA